MSMKTDFWGDLCGIRPVKIAVRLLKEGRNRSEIIEYFIKTHGVVPQKAALVFDVAMAELPIINNSLDNGISIYIGIPFCPTRCVYCSFVTNGAGKNLKYIPDYLNCLKREIEFVGELVNNNGYIVETIYIGGGTPTTLSEVQLAFILEAVYDKFDLSKLKEFTIEAGRPDTITCGKLETIKRYGIDRISINPQSMNENTLKTIGRNHTPKDIIRAFNISREFGFNNINMDIIAGLPGESLDGFKRTVEEVEKLSPENTTVHTMSIKRSSILHEMIENYGLTPPDTVRMMVDYASDYMYKSAKRPYYLYRQKNMLGNFENIGYTKDGCEGIYNIHIMEEIQTIISLGAGGVTKIVDCGNNRIERIFNVKEPKDYIERIDEMLDRKRVLESVK